VSDTKFTPGPWVVSDTHPKRACLYISSPEDLWKTGDVATVYCAGAGTHEQDAHLIAAAPDMYSLLDRLFHECSDDLSGFAEMEIANVLKKARGES